MRFCKNIFLVPVLAIVLLGSCARFNYQQGTIEYGNGNYSKAISYLEKASSKKNEHDIQFKLANAYRLTNNTVKAEPLYKLLVDSSATDLVNLFYYGKLLMNNEKYEEARIIFKKYLTLSPYDVTVKALFLSCDSISVLKSNTTAYSVKQEDIGNFNFISGVTPYKNGVVFSASKEKYLDLYFGSKDSTGKWNSPELLKGVVDGPFHEGSATFSKNENTMYFTRSNYKTWRLKKNEQNTNTLKIFKAVFVEGKWKNIEELPFGSTEYSVGQPSLSEDGTTLYFVSDMPGGYGQTDIYVSNLENGKWSKPVNLGSAINTPGKEFSPFIHNDTLYFSSDAHTNMGGLDIFWSHYDGYKWSAAHNMRAPINSSKDDYSFVLSGNGTGYFSSDRFSGQDNIFSFVKKRKEKVPVMDSLTLSFLLLIKGNDSIDLPIVKEELMKVSTVSEKDSLLRSEKQFIEQKNENTEKKYARTISQLVKDKKEKDNIDIIARTNEKKKANAMAVLATVSKKPEQAIKETKEKLPEERKDKSTDKSKEAKGSASPAEHIGVAPVVAIVKRPTNIIYKQKENHTTHFVVSVQKPTDVRQAPITYTDDIKAENAKLEQTIAELEQLYFSKSKDPKALLIEAKERNEVISNAFLTKEKSERERYLMILAKSISNNMNLKYEKGNPLTDLYDIIDAYDKLMLKLNKNAGTN